MSNFITNFTKLIRVSDGQYPIYFQDVRRAHKNVSFSAKPTVEQLRARGYEVVTQVAKPEGDVVIEGAPTVVDGVWTQVWTVREFTQEEVDTQLDKRKEELIVAANKYREKLLDQGIIYNYNGDSYHVQVRDGDRANLAGLRIVSDQRVAAGDETITVFRVKENVNLSLTPSEVVDLTNAALVGYYGILNTVWDLKDLINLAESIEDLPVIPA